MSGDYSRIDFDPLRDYTRVLLQQGRPLTDADWNELVAQLARRMQAGSYDTFGGADVVCTSTPDAFKLAFDANSHLTIGRGRIYVDGLLAENHGTAPLAWDSALAEQFGTNPTRYDQQPYLPNAPALPASGGPHIVYVDVWEREVTQFEDPNLVEKALGVDTTTRVQTVWQVKVLANSQGASLTCDSTPADWNALIAPSAGRLTTDTATFGSTNPCLIPPSGGYTGLENQLYRIEIHQGGAPGTATFKWSRDNASVETRVTRFVDLHTIVVESVGKDSVLRFNDGDWIEITDDWLELTGVPSQPNAPHGELHRITVGSGVDDALRTITLDTPVTAGLFPVDAQGKPDANRHTRIRRWDQRGQVLRTDTPQPSNYFDLDSAGSTGAIPVPASNTVAVALENGIVVKFDVDPAGGTFHSGDYWVFAARAVDASVEPLDHAPPRGIHHHYTKLGLITLPNTVTDCRTFWPPKTGEQGCDCTVCVSAQDHNSGTLTLQYGIDQVKGTGGTVCLGPGVYQLGTALNITDAGSVRVRGQGWRTILVALEPQTAVQIEESIEVTLENLTVVGAATASGARSVIGLRNNFGCRLQRLAVVGVSPGDAVSVGIGLAGYAFATTIENCVVAADVGIASSIGEKANYLLSVDLAIEDNVIWCSQRGVSFERFVIHAAEARLRGNTVVGSRFAGLLTTGGVLPGSTLNIAGNVVQTSGAGIVVGTDGTRIVENDVSAQAGTQTGDGVALMPGLDPSGIDACQIFANRVSGVPGHGVAVRTRVNSGMIKQNIIANVGGGGIVMEQGGSAGNLVVENNQLLNIAVSFNQQGEQIAAVRVIAAERADVLNNLIRNVARASIQSQGRAGIQLAGVTEARISGNTLSGIGPIGEQAGQSAGIHLLPSFFRMDVAGNSVRRAADDSENPAAAVWRALAVTGAEGLFIVTPSLTVVSTGQLVGFFTASHLRILVLRQDNVSARGNSFRGEVSALDVVRIDDVEHCLFAENHCLKTSAAVGAGGQNVVQMFRGGNVVANANRVRGSDPKLSSIALWQQKTGRAVLANVTGSPIQIDGVDIAPPWRDLNIVAP